LKGDQQVLITEEDKVKTLVAQYALVADTRATEVKGRVAQPGIAQGRVQLVFYPEDARKVEKGDILVASETTPDFLPAMRRAAAIVTDQGGITSHAAIVSRELQIPCVVGTKVATQIFKTGDYVEVDAMTGIVSFITYC